MKKSALVTRSKRVALETTVVVVAGAFLAHSAVPDARAAEVLRPEPIALAAVAPVPAAKRPKAAAKKPPRAETYEQRQDRIARSTTPLLATPKDTEPVDRTCVSGEFTTLAVIYESLVQSLLPSLPPQAREAVLAQSSMIKRDMQRITVSTLGLSDHPKALGADDDDPSTKYRSPHSQAIVSALLKIRDGKENEAIPVGNITLSQAVETAWLVFFTGILEPGKFATSVAPDIFTELATPLFPEVSALKSLDYGLLLSVGFVVIRLGLTQAYQAISDAILESCIAEVTDEQKDSAGAPSETVVYDIPIHPIIRSIADQLGLADTDTCTPVGDLTLGRIVTRTGEAAKEQAPTAATKRQIDAQVRQLLGQMRAVHVPHHLIPADPYDWTTVGTIGSYIGSAIPYVGGAPLDILIGLGHNLGDGKNLGETVPLDQLTVTKSLTAAYFSYYLAVHLFTEIGDGLTSGGVAPAPFRIVGKILDLPLTYGLVTYHNVVRSMCLREDDTTGTGLGAERNKADYAAGIQTPQTTKKNPATGTSKATSSATPKGAQSKTTAKATQPKATQPKATRSATPTATAPTATTERASR